MLTLSAEVIAINRLVIGESERFPEIAKTFYQSAIVPVNAIIEGWLTSAGRQGRLRIDDIHVASGMLRGMMIFEPQRIAMLRQREAPDAGRDREPGQNLRAGFSSTAAGSDGPCGPGPSHTLSSRCSRSQELITR